MGLITWNFGGEEWSGIATVSDEVDFISPSGNLHRYVQNVDAGEMIEITFGDFTFRENVQWRVQTFDDTLTNQSRIELDAFQGSGQWLENDNVIEEGYFSWGVRLRFTERAFEPLGLPEIFVLPENSEIVEAGVYVGSGVDGLMPWQEMTHFAGAEIPVERWVRPEPSGGSIPEPSAGAFILLACVISWFWYNWRGRSERRRRSESPK